jgi:hypothetical protein
MVGNFEVNSDLIQIVTNILLIAEHYLKQCLDTITQQQFSDFILTSLNSESFTNSAFYLSVAAYLDENSDMNNDLQHQFKRVEKLLDIKYNYWNYSEFINWYFQQ